MIDAKQHASYADLQRLPNDVAGQLIDGALVIVPQPGAAHARVCEKLGVALEAAFGGGEGRPGDWRLLPSPELHLGADVLVADLAGWRSERLALPSSPRITVAPDWVGEVLAAESVELDRVAKRRIYAREHVAFLWVVDPQARTLSAWKLERGEYRQLGTWGGEAVLRAQPFEAVPLALATLWS